MHGHDRDVFACYISAHSDYYFGRYGPLYFDLEMFVFTIVAVNLVQVT